MSDETQKKNIDDHGHHSYHNLGKSLWVTAVALASLVGIVGAQNRQPPNDNEKQKIEVVIKKDTSVTGNGADSVAIKTTKSSSNKGSDFASNPLNAKKFSRVAGFEEATYLPELHAYSKATNVNLDTLAGSSNDFLLSYTLPDGSGKDHNYWAIVRRFPGARGGYLMNATLPARIPSGDAIYGELAVSKVDGQYSIHTPNDGSPYVDKKTMDAAIDGQQR